MLKTTSMITNVIYTWDQKTEVCQKISVNFSMTVNPVKN